MIFKIKYKLLLGAIFISSLISVNSALAATLDANLSGRILLQVQSKGEAWYVNPQNNKRYYLGKPDDAYSLMRSLSLGISEKEFASWSQGAPVWARGRLYLRPQSHGEAYYVDLNRRWHYLGRPMDAWLLFRAQGLGITNSDLSKISIALAAPVTTSNVAPAVGFSDYKTNLVWRYKLENFNLDLPLRSSLNSEYEKAVKAFYYTGDTPPVNAREQFYNIFFNKKSGDTSISYLVNYGKQEAATHSWSKDQTADFLLALIQYIPYDSAKLNKNPLQPNYPYETLYKNSGICSDKTFLAVTVLRELGYGAAILDFPDANHSAAGISCPVSESINNSGYCYIETTNYFPVGVIPPTISNGQAVAAQDNLSNLFNISHLSKIEIFQKTTGLVYQGIANTKKIVTDLQAKDVWIEAQKIGLAEKNSNLTAQQSILSAQQTQLSAYQASGNISAYNSLVETYNLGVIKYNSDLELYRAELTNYNNMVNDYNQGLKGFYQQ